MDDILTVGKDRGPTWRKRGLIAIAVALAVAVVAVKYWPADHHQSAHPAPRRAAAKEPVPRILPGVVGVPGEASAQQLRLMSGIRLPVAGPQPLWFWPATGRAEPIGGLPVTGAGYRFARVTGGWALTRSTFLRPACTPCLSALLPAYFLPGDASAARWAGTANVVAPAASAGHLWLTSYQPGAHPGSSVGLAREADVQDNTLGPVVQLPAGYAIDGQTDRGLLLAPTARHGGQAAFLLRKPRNGQAGHGRSFGTVLAVGARQVAWVRPCARRCAVNVTDVVTGHVLAVRQAAGDSAVSAAFSPDEKYLAVRVKADVPGAGKDAPNWLYVVSLRTGQVWVVPGIRTSGGTLTTFGWPDDTDTLVAELALPSEVQLVAWRPGASAPDVVTLQPGLAAARLVLG